MRAISLLYHDVVIGRDFNSSGFPGPRAARYKLERDDFERHLAAIARACTTNPENQLRISEAPGRPLPWLLTFDDGGLSAYTCVMELLDQYGWSGHFFITADYIGKAGFLRGEQIRTLRQRGHVIGSHSCSHPERMSHCDHRVLVEEWRRSTDILSNILGEPVKTASVPGGYYSRKVAEAASVAGVKILFNSEPTTRSQEVDSCKVFGRYAVLRGMSPAAAAAICSARLWPRLKQLLWWNLRKPAKSVGGPLYLSLRRLLLRNE